MKLSSTKWNRRLSELPGIFLCHWLRTTLCICVCVSIFVDEMQAASLKAGAAASNITPELGQPVEGYGSRVPTSRVHDELHARCLVLDDGETTLAIVVCDLLGIQMGLSAKARRLIEERCGIPAKNVLICATHSHSTVGGTRGGQRFAKSEEGLNPYQQFVVSRIVDGVLRAKNNLSPAELAFGSVNAPEHVFNRRIYMRPGTMPKNPFGGEDRVQMNPPGNSPNYVGPAGPTDPAISFLSVRAEDGSPLALYASYSMHYVGNVPPQDVSADYFGEFCRQLSRKMEVEGRWPQFVPMLCNGTSGDVVSFDFKSARPKNPPYERIKIIAADLADRIDAAQRTLDYRKDITLAVRYREPQVQMRHPDAALLSWAEHKLEELKDLKTEQKTDRGISMSFDYARRAKAAAAYPKTAPAPLQVFRIGKTFIGSMPFEIFCETGLAFKRQAVQQPAFLVSLANGYMGYLPTPEQHELGGYETWLGTNHVKSDTSELLLRNLLEMVEEVKLAE